MGITLPANLNVYVSAILFVLGAYLFALYLGLIVWTFRDIHARSRDFLAQVMATLLVAVFSIAGWLVYLLVRPRTTLAEEYERRLAEEAMLQELDQRRICPKCQRRIESDFVVCPHCHRGLRRRCVECTRLLDMQWQVCPYCATPQPKADADGRAFPPTAIEAPQDDSSAEDASPELAGEPAQPMATDEQSETDPNA